MNNTIIKSKYSFLRRLFQPFIKYSHILAICLVRSRYGIDLLHWFLHSFLSFVSSVTKMCPWIETALALFLQNWLNTHYISFHFISMSIPLIFFLSHWKCKASGGQKTLRCEWMWEQIWMYEWIEWISEPRNSPASHTHTHNGTYIC